MLGLGFGVWGLRFRVRAICNQPVATVSSCRAQAQNIPKLSILNPEPQTAKMRLRSTVPDPRPSTQTPKLRPLIADPLHSLSDHSVCRPSTPNFRLTLWSQYPSGKPSTLNPQPQTSDLLSGPSILLVRRLKAIPRYGAFDPILGQGTRLS